MAQERQKACNRGMPVVRTRSRAVAILVVALLGALLPGLAAAPAAAEVPSPLDLRSVTEVPLEEPAGLAELLVLPDADRVITAVPARLRVYDRLGRITAERTEPGAHLGWVQLSPDGLLLYALLSTDEVAVYEARTLLPLGRRAIPTAPDEDCVGGTAPAGGRYWIYDRCLQSIVSTDALLATDYVVAPSTEGVYQVARLEPLGEDLLLLGRSPTKRPDGSPGLGYVLDRLELHGTDLQRVARLADVSPLWASPVLLDGSPDGRTVLLGGQLHDGETLQRLPGDVQHPWGRDAVLVRDGRHVLGSAEWPTDTAAVWISERANPVWWVGDGDHGWGDEQVGVSADGSIGVVLDHDRLLFLDFGQEQARLSLDAPNGPADDTVDGRLALSDGTLPIGLVVTVERVEPTGAVPVGVALPSSDGRFSVRDLGHLVASSTYRARWLGDLRHPEGAIAILPAEGGARRVPAPADPPLDLRVEVPMATLRPTELVVDEGRRRLLVLGAAPDLLGSGTTGRIDVYGFDGLPRGPLLTAGEPADVALTPDQAHVLVLEPALAQVEVFDATTLLPVGTITTEPWLVDPRRLAVVGADLWVSAATGPTAVAPLRAPTELQRVSIPYSTNARLLPVEARTGFAYAVDHRLQHLDATNPYPDGPRSTAASWGSPGAVVVPATATAPVRSVHEDALVDRHPTTLEPLDERTLDSGRVHLVAGVAGPEDDLVLTLSQDWEGNWHVPPQDAAPSVKGFVAAWDDGPAPFRTIAFPDATPIALAASPSGGHAFVVTAQGRHDQPALDVYRLVVLADPYARCAVTLDLLPPILRGLDPVTVTGTVAGLPPGATPDVTIELAGGLVTATVQPDGTFTATVTPQALGGSTVRVRIAETDVGACTVERVLDLLAPVPVPFDTTLAFVERQVADVLGVAVDPDMTAALVAALDDGSLDPDVMIWWLLAISDVSQGAVARLHWAALGRWPTAGELGARIAALVAGAPFGDLVGSLAADPAFAARYGQPSRDGFVTAAYRNVLGRAPSPAERSMRQAQLAAGRTRGQVVANLAASPEARTRLAPFLEPVLAYAALLDRVPTGVEAWSWIVARASGATVPDLVRQVRLGPAYAELVAGDDPLS